MELNTVENHLGKDAKHLRDDIVADLKAEAAHITDPSQYGYVVRRHFDGIMFILLTFILLFLAAAGVAFRFTFSQPRKLSTVFIK